MSLSNLFDTLNSLDSDSPIMSSTPIKPSHGTSGKNNTKTKQTNPNSLKVLNINFQSINNKTAQFHHILDSVKPDIVAGTETWLSMTSLTMKSYPNQWDILCLEKTVSSEKGEDSYYLSKTTLFVVNNQSLTQTVKQFGLRLT